ncbi:hypothetical protein A8C56_03305 [Niabella ginsenosidivorans]|uniref:Uncharacterized protein n=1 Tax=Niabella ginsenosidivorans TaxID=1176587 RepID=A0A1A9I076_9BACT|nr:hypothetical protein [Niabella ginsenosidivorans]ANH80140.1 hypothetical protein A8C56_03305 [Niabella ginsenosidivorans]
MTKRRLIKRLTWYYPAELSGAITFSCCFLLVLTLFPVVNALFLLYGLFLFSFILWQGQHYWKLKLRSLKGVKIQQAKNLALFKRARQTNLLLICFIPVILSIQLYYSGRTLLSKNLTAYGIIANLMGILEYINYYVKQIMIDNKYDLEYLIKNKKLKTPGLIKDLRAHNLQTRS